MMMDVFGPLLVLAATIWAVFHMNKSSKKGSNWIAFILALATGILIAGSVIAEWVGQYGGDFAGYAGAALLIIDLFLGGWDLRDKKPDGMALTAALSAPTLVAVSLPLLKATTSDLFTGGVDVMISGV